MVAKPTTETPAIFEQNMWVDGDATPSPIHLDFRQVLKILAEAGIDGAKLDRWFLDLNEANRELVGKLELTSEGVLLISPMQSKSGSRWESIVGGELYIWTQLHGGESHGSRLGIRTPTETSTHPTRRGCRPNNWRHTPHPRKPGCWISAPISWSRSCPATTAWPARTQDAGLHRPRRNLGVAHRPLPP